MPCSGSARRPRRRGSAPSRWRSSCRRRAPRRGRAVGDHAPSASSTTRSRERGDELRVVGGDEHGGVELAQQRGELVLAPRSMPRVGSSRQTTAGGSRSAIRRAPRRARSPAPAAASRRPTGRAGGGRRTSPASSPTLASAAGEASSRDALVDEVVGRVLKQQRDPPRAAGPCRGSGCISPAACRSSVDLPAPLRPISATRSPGATSSETPRRITGPERSSCQTRSSRERGSPARSDRAGVRRRAADARAWRVLVRRRQQPARRAAAARAALDARDRRASRGRRAAARPASRARAPTAQRPGQELRRAGRRRRSARRASRSPGRRQPGSARAGARRARSPCRSPR